MNFWLILNNPTEPCLSCHVNDSNNSCIPTLNITEKSSREREERKDEKKSKETREKSDTRHESEKSKKSKIRCKYSDNEEGCMKKRCEYMHPLPSEHCKKWLNGGGCLTRFCKFRHVEAERRRLMARRNEKKRERTETSPISRATRMKLERAAEERKKSSRDDRSLSRKDRDFRQGAQHHLRREHGLGVVPRDRRMSRWKRIVLDQTREEEGMQKEENHVSF